ncbi:hypothetical protein [Escherichia phage vB_EcoS_PJ16]|nr:hypothetical protein [Escherichia phage vB_EcoS_PJ16]HCP1922268.1 hypothetical protein [Escherichia coli]
MSTYDGVPVKIIAENTRGDLELEVTEKMPWDASPDVGDRFWINTPDCLLMIGDTK